MTINNPSQSPNPLKMRRAADLLKHVYSRVDKFIQPGITTLDLDGLVRRVIQIGGGKSATVGYRPTGASVPFPAACCTSVNSVIAHGIPDSTVLKDGDIISVDIALSVDGHFADACRTYIIGEVPTHIRDLVNASEDLTHNIIQFISNNIGKVTLKDVGAYCEFHATRLGYYVLPGLGGHGIGLQMHCSPFIPPVAHGASNEKLLPGMFITVEPVLAMVKTDISLADDGWTLYSPTNVLSAQFENTIMICKDHVEILTE